MSLSTFSEKIAFGYKGKLIRNIFILFYMKIKCNSFLNYDTINYIYIYLFKKYCITKDKIVQNPKNFFCV